MILSARDIPSRIPAFARTLLERCDALHTLAWYLGANGDICAPAASSVEINEVFSAEPTIRALSDTIGRCVIGPRVVHAEAEIFSGANALIVPVRVNRHAVGHVVIVVLNESSLESPELREASDAMSLLVMNEDDHRIETLRWTCEDLAKNATLERDIETFGRQLTESYEEIALLYKLREGISAETNPVHFVDEACRDLLAVIPYAWLGVCFTRERRAARALAGETVLFGQAPCSSERFRYSVDLMSHALTPGSPRVLTGEERGSFTDGTSQVAVIPFGKQDHIVGTIVAGGKTNNEDTVTSIDMKMLEAVAGHMLVLIENAGLYADQRDTFIGTLQALTTAIDAKDRYTCGHSERVAYLSEQIALASGVSPQDAERIRISGLVHDVGKIGVPESVLRKPGKLTDVEYDQIKLHPEIGHAILKDIPMLEDVLPGVLYHHERFDGRGYPFGIEGEEIPLMARVIGLADAFDAMSSSRTYRQAMPRAKVLSEIEKGAGTQFDPQLAERFLTIDLYHYDEMVARHHTQANGGQQEAA